MNSKDQSRIEQFIERWQGSSGNETANSQPFFMDLCDALGVDRPPDKGRVKDDPYCFEKDVKIYHPSGKVTPGFIDFYKAEHFLIEAKQGGTTTGKGTAKRGTNSYLKAMEAAFVQAIAYTRSLKTKPPFVLTCDVGDHFELWTGFNGDYGGYGARKDIQLDDLRRKEIFDLFVDIFSNPQKQDPEKISAKVTREVSADLAELAKDLETEHNSEDVAHFLMRCIFTMFAEDVGLLKEHLFTDALENRWLPSPKTFKTEAEALWKAMNEGTAFGFYGKLLRFNGGLFAKPKAFSLNAKQIKSLLDAAKRDWKNVEPAIFGTLLERALDPKERSKLGAHYTPRSYVERLVKPVVIEPIQEQWDLVQGEVKQILEELETRKLTPKQQKNRRDKACSVLEKFLTELQNTKILDPACGSGNFLYVTLDLLKGLESEVLKRLADITGQAQMRLDINQVNPSQFLGIEINERAAAIADLVIWIGYLQWHFRRFGDIPPIEPVLREYKNIECRDAVLAYDGKEPDIDPKTGEVRTRWGGKMMTHPVTGKKVPDSSDRVVIYRYLNVREAEWPEADYVVSNPPFIGNARMREILGDGYSEALRSTYSQIPSTVDYVMYWWSKSAQLLKNKCLQRFGLITTNTIRQVWQRSVIDHFLSGKVHLKIYLAIPDHPWVEGGAAVRTAMTAACLNEKNEDSHVPKIGQIISEKEGKTPEDQAHQTYLRWEKVSKIFSNLKAGVDISKAHKLRSNKLLSGRGVYLHGSGFRLNDEELSNWGYKYLNEVIKPFISGRDLVGKIRNIHVIDFFELSEAQASKYPEAFQKIINEVRPHRIVNERGIRKENWWLFGENMPKTRYAIRDLKRYIATTRTAKHKFFLFLPNTFVPESEVISVGLEDAFHLGVMSSYIHSYWALAAGGDLGGNTPRYNNTVCFEPFPFPDPTSEQKQKIRELGERLDSHRKQVQTNHPDITITGMYNLLEKLRAGESFTEKDREYNNKALVTTLKQIHDELDEVVFEVYGWQDLWAELQSGQPADQINENILERLVALNAERAEEERNGLVRWLRPEYQAPDEVKPTQTTIKGTETDTETVIEPVEQQKWPTKFKDQLAAVRNLLRTNTGEWTVNQIASQFKTASQSKHKIESCLESLEALGIVASHNEEAITHWYSSELQAIS